MSRNKKDSGIEVKEEYRMDWDNLSPLATRFIAMLDRFQRAHRGFDYHMQAQRESGHFFIFTNIPAGDPAKARGNIVLEYQNDGVAIGAGLLDRTPIMHKLWHRVESIDEKLHHMLTNLKGRPDIFRFKFKSDLKPKLG